MNRRHSLSSISALIRAVDQLAGRCLAVLEPLVASSGPNQVGVMANIAAILLVLAPALLVSSDWPQFRGPNAAGVSEDTNLPVAFGPAENVVWHTPIPAGNSSPVVAGDKVYLTGFETD